MLFAAGSVRLAMVALEKADPLEPDLLDAALLRPGRLDRLIFCDFPSPRERLDILTFLSRKLVAVHEHLSNANNNEPGKMLVITNTVLKSIASKARPSVSEAEIKGCMATAVSLWIQSDLPIGMQKARGQLRFEIFSLKRLLLHLASFFFYECDSMELRETRLLIGGKRTLNWRYLLYGVVE
ncbi:hypothetical protein Gotur_021791 [Gossypium turneri]